MTVAMHLSCLNCGKTCAACASGAHRAQARARQASCIPYRQVRDSVYLAAGQIGVMLAPSPVISSRNPGKLVAIGAESSMVTASAVPSPRQRKLIAIR